MNPAPIYMHPSLAFIIIAALVLFFPGRISRWLTTLLATLVAIVIAFFFDMDHGSFWIVPYMGNSLVLGRVDDLSMLFVTSFALLSIICFIFSLHVKDKGHQVTTLFLVAGSFGCILAGDYWTLFIAWNIASISSTFLIWLNRTSKSGVIGFRYILIMLSANLIVFAGVLLKYKSTGNFQFDHVDSTMMRYYDWIILLGFAIKAAIVPLHGWLTEAYPASTETGGVFLSTFPTAIAVYALARCYTGLDILAGIGVFMAVYGSLFALMENRFRRVLSYLIVSQTGFIIAGLGIDKVNIINGSLSQAYAFVLYSGLLFMCAGCLLRACGTDDLTKLGGLARRLPLVCASSIVGALAVSCLPLLNGFVSTPRILFGTIAANRPILAAWLWIALIITFASIGLRLIYYVFWTKPTDSVSVARIPANMYVAMIIAAALCFFQGIFPLTITGPLPYPGEYNPYRATYWIWILIMLAGTCISFFFLHKIFKPRPFRLPDFDQFYLLCGRLFYRSICIPFEWADGWWSEVYRVFGMRGLLGAGYKANDYDEKYLDSAVDETAHRFHWLGGLFSRLQTGHLQEQLTWMLIVALVVFGICWYII